MTRLIQISHLSKHYGYLKAVDDISFNVNAGEVLGFLGPNGAGKTTTMRMITGFLTPDKGTITVANFDVTTDPVDVKRAIGYLPEGAPVYPDMTPWQFLNFIAQIRGFSGQKKRQTVSQVIEKIHLEPVAHQPIETLSKGFKQRVGLAQAIIHDPPILILDEPTDGLDPNQKFEVRKLIKQMAATKAIVLSTHILEEVEVLCDRVIIIAGGKIVANSTPKALKAQSKHYKALIIGVYSKDALSVKNVLSQLTLPNEIELLEEIDDITYYRLQSANQHTLLSQVNNLCRHRPWTIHTLRIEEGRLDEVFRTITQNTQIRN